MELPNPAHRWLPLRTVVDTSSLDQFPIEELFMLAHRSCLRGFKPATARSVSFVRTTLLVALCVQMVSGCDARQGKTSLRVGYQKWGTCSILKASGRLDSVLKSSGQSVEWIEFPSGPPLLEALNAGSIDVGHTGDSPPLFAQAAGIPFVYIAASSPSPQSSALVVRENDNLQSVSDLKGKRIGLTKGSSAHTLVIRLLEQHDLTLSDVELVYLTPADARVALTAGSIDAWSIWDPYLSSVEHSQNARQIADGRGTVSGREFYVASRSAVEKHPQLIHTFLRELAGAKEWAKSHPDKMTQLLSDQTGLPIAAVKLAESRRNRFDTSPITEELIAEQQSLADRYYALGLLPHTICVKDIADRSFGEFVK